MLASSSSSNVDKQVGREQRLDDNNNESVRNRGVQESPATDILFLYREHSSSRFVSNR